MHPLLNIAVGAARQAGSLILRYLNQLDTLPVAEKARNDYVSRVDRQAEEVIIDAIHKAYPDHAILGEETGSHGEGDYCWIIDPLDGTTNFLHGFPVFAVSIGIRHKGQMEHGVVYDPLRQEIFSASRGAGAQLDGRRIRVSARKSLKGALIGTGFPYRGQQTDLDRYLATLRAVIEETAGVRRPGAAALDLCYVAAGRLDGFWEWSLQPWDVAAGSLIIREAGGRISDFRGGDGYFDQGEVVAGNPRVYAELSKLIARRL